MVCIVRVIRPRREGKGQRSSVLFFGSIAQTTEDDFLRTLRNMDYDTALTEMGIEMHQSAKIAQAKYADSDQALAAFTRAIELDAERATTHYNLGLVYSYRDSTTRAVRAYEAALRIDSTLAPAHKKLGLHYREKGESDRARNHLQQAARHAPADAEIHFYLGLLHRNFGRVVNKCVQRIGPVDFRKTGLGQLNGSDFACPQIVARIGKGHFV